MKVGDKIIITNLKECEIISAYNLEVGDIGELVKINIIDDKFGI